MMSWREGRGGGDGGGGRRRDRPQSHGCGKIAASFFVGRSGSLVRGERAAVVQLLLTLEVALEAVEARRRVDVEAICGWV